MNGPAALPEAALPRLLIVDDEPRNLRLLANIFADDYQLSLATSARKAMELLEITEGIELILLDMMMPDVDGQELFDALRAQPSTRDIPVIFITARHDVDAEIHALGSGAVDYLHKPVHVGLARQRVRQQITLARQRRELQLAREAADAGSRAKSQFLTGVSHELRTPLNAILGFSQVLMLDDTLGETQRASVQEIREAGQHLLDLINDVLDLGAIEAARVDLTPAPVDLTELARSCIRLCEPLAQRQKVTLQLSVAAQAANMTAWGDRTRVRQVLVNLLSNAIKFNRAGGHVSVLVGSTDDGHAQLAVLDDGPGIEPELQARLFEPFSRGSTHVLRGVEGTGIGLTICKRLMEAMHGRIGFESEPGRGTRFWITLPAVCETTSAPRSAAADDESNAGAARRNPADTLAEVVTDESADGSPNASSDGASDAAAASAPPQPRTVLCIDDNPSNLKLLEIVLRRLPGVKVVPCIDPEKALPLALQHRPDCVLVDIQMPGIDGYEVLRRLRAVPALAVVPAAALSANAMPEDVRQGLAAGFLHYFTKPFDVPELLRAVEAMMQARRVGQGR